jgi:transcriptional regulator with XRE-family HTH domain
MLVKHIVKSNSTPDEPLTYSILFKPLFLYRFRLIAPIHPAKVEYFLKTHPEPDHMASTADKLRWYRYKSGRRQQEVADYADIDRSSYIYYEKPAREYYPLNKMLKIAEFLEIDVHLLLDEYNLFLCSDPGKQIEAKRKALGLSREKFAKLLGVAPSTIGKWETEKIRITKKTWKKVMSIK